jgi:methylase of polypeptide subunit release factors
MSTLLSGNTSDQALLNLGLWLRQIGYRFITPTPATHAVINARPGSGMAKSVEGVFGWSRPFHASLLPQSSIKLLEQADAVAYDGSLLRSKVRYSTLGNLLFVHSAFPTNDRDAVFFGPDTYRFTRFVAQVVHQRVPVSDPGPIFDMCCGSGVGGIFVKTLLPNASEVVLADINSKALRYAWVNAKLAGMVSAVFRQGDLFLATPEQASMIIANPPYLVDREARVYRDGGGELGSELSMRIVREGLPKLKPGGVMILYTGVSIVDGKDTFLAVVAEALRSAALKFSYEEIDPDVFGEELQHAPYAGVDRIAAVGLVIHKAAW